MRKDVLLALSGAIAGAAIGLSGGAAVQPPLLTYQDLLARKSLLADRRIAYGENPQQFGEFWKPARRGRARVVVLIHGGCWQASLPGLELMNGLAADLRGRGYAVWNIEYRRLGSPGGGYPGTFQDVGRAMDFLRVLSRTDHLDLGNIVVVGHSAGGHLALWAAARDRLPHESALSGGHPIRLAGVLTLAGINDLAAYRNSGIDACGGPGTIDDLVGARTRVRESPYSDTSPSDLLPLGVAQTIVSGELDPIVPARLGEAYAARAARDGDSVTAVTIPRAGHFELIDPSGPAWPGIARAIRRLSRGWARG